MFRTMIPPRIVHPSKSSIRAKGYTEIYRYRYRYMSVYLSIYQYLYLYPYNIYVYTWMDSTHHNTAANLTTFGKLDELSV